MFVIDYKVQNSSAFKRYDYVAALAILWALMSLVNSFVSMRGTSLFEKIYFSCANSYVFFSGIGFSCIILLSSGLLSAFFEKSGKAKALKRWLYSCTCFMGIIICFVALYAIIHREAANSWSAAAIAMSFSNTAPLVNVPLLPAIKELMDILTPFHASLCQLILLFLCMMLYGLAFLLSMTLTKNKQIAIIVIFLFHIIGQYTIDAWPYWAECVPHSYFFFNIMVYGTLFHYLEYIRVYLEYYCCFSF